MGNERQGKQGQGRAAASSSPARRPVGLAPLGQAPPIRPAAAAAPVRAGQVVHLPPLVAAGAPAPHQDLDRPATARTSHAAVAMSSALPQLAEFRLWATPTWAGGMPSESRQRGRTLVPLVAAAKNEMKEEMEGYGAACATAGTTNAVAMAATVAGVACTLAGAAPAAAALSITSGVATIASANAELAAGAIMAARPDSPTLRGNSLATLHRLDGEQRMASGIAGLVVPIAGAGFAVGRIHRFTNADERREAEMALVNGARRHALRQLNRAGLAPILEEPAAAKRGPKR